MPSEEEMEVQHLNNKRWFPQGTRVTKKVKIM